MWREYVWLLYGGKNSERCRYDSHANEWLNASEHLVCGYSRLSLPLRTRFAEGTTWSARWTYSLTASGSSPARSDQLVACLLQLSWVVFNQLIFNLSYLFQIIWVESLYMGAAKDREVAIVLLPWAVRHTSYLLLVKSNWWSIINAAFWLVELLLGYML